MSEIKPVISYELVYQSQTDGVWHDVRKTDFDARSHCPDLFKQRILYPAAAYEYMKNCADELLAENNKILIENEQVRSSCAKLLSEQDYKYNKQINELLKRHVDKLDVAAEFCRQLQIEIAKLKAKNEFIEDAARDYERENAFLKSENQTLNMCVEDSEKACQELVRKNNHLQFLLDSVMLEFCPDEMTEEQMENWSKHQKKSNMEIKL